MTDPTPMGTDASDPGPSAEGPAQQSAAPTWPVGYSMGAQAAAARATEPPPQSQQYPAIPVVAPGPQTSSSAIVALVLAIASWAVCPIVPAIIALVFASKADREIAASGRRIQGAGLSTAAKIVSWINIGVYMALVVVLTFVAIIVVIAGGLSQVTPAGQV